MTEFFTKGSLNMTPERKIQVLELMLGYHLRKAGFTLSGQTRRDLDNAARKLKIPIPEFLEVAKPIVQDLVDEVFGIELPETPDAPK